MKTNHLLILTTSSLLAGLLFFAYQQELIIVRFKSGLTKAHAEQTVSKKIILLHYWNKEKWHQEPTQLIWPSNKAMALQYLITSWLTLLSSEKIHAKNCALQTVVLSPGGEEAYISFDTSPFANEQSIQEKWYWIEGLLKTIKQTTIGIQRVRFLVHHKPLDDYHLDFTNSWPIQGFIT